MMKGLSSLRSALAAGRRVHGTFVKLPSMEVVEIAAETLDFAVVDLEHSQLSEADALRLVHHGWALGFPVLVRLHASDSGLVNRLLEAGAAGIQLSSVRSAAEVHALRAACLYAPDGVRSVSLAHSVARFGAIPLEEYVRSSASPLVVIQLETADTDDPVEEILADGVDVAFIGVTDLTVELGFDAEVVRERIDALAAASARAGVVLGGFGSDERFMYAIESSDLALLRAAYARG